MIVTGYETITIQALPDYPWMVWTAPLRGQFEMDKHIDYEWLDTNIADYRMSAYKNILVKTEQDAMLIYMAFLP